MECRSKAIIVASRSAPVLKGRPPQVEEEMLEEIKERRRNERIVERLMVEQFEAALRERWEGGPKPATPPVLVVPAHDRLYDASTEKTELYEAQIRERKSLVLSRRAASAVAAARRKDAELLCRTVGCNVGLVRRHLEDEVVRRQRARDAEAAAARGVRSRESEATSRSLRETARIDVVEARRLQRAAGKETLRRQVEAARRRRPPEVKKRLVLTAFSSLVPLDDDVCRRRKRAALLSEWRKVLEDDRRRVSKIRTARLAEYAKTHPPTTSFPDDVTTGPIFDGTDHFLEPKVKSPPNNKLPAAAMVSAARIFNHK